MATSLDPDSTVSVPQRPRLRSLAVFLGFLMCLPVTWAVANANQSGIFSLMVPPVSGLLALLILNVPLRRFASRFALTQTT